MTKLTDLTISLNGLIWVFTLLAVLAIVFTLFVYRRTNPIVANSTRYILSALRIIALLSVLLLIFEPIIGITYNKKEKPNLAVLIDTSASMALTDVEVKRDSVLFATLKQPVFDDIENNYNIFYYTFGSTANRIEKSKMDSLRFLGDVTDIRHSLENVKEQFHEQSLAAILLLSDGAYNLGGNPVRFVEEMGVPIYTIGIGSNKEAQDIALVGVSANKFSYLDIASPVKVKVRTLGFPETRTRIYLRRGKQIIESKEIRLPEAPADLEVELSFTPHCGGFEKQVKSSHHIWISKY